MQFFTTIINLNIRTHTVPQSSNRIVTSWQNTRQLYLAPVIWIRGANNQMVTACLWCWQLWIRTTLGSKFYGLKTLSVHPAANRYLIQFREGEKAAEGERWALPSIKLCPRYTKSLNTRNGSLLLQPWDLWTPPPPFFFMSLLKVSVYINYYRRKSFLPFLIVQTDVFSQILWGLN